jgi:hypothetical protein
MRSPASSERRSPFALATLARALTDADERLVVWKGGHDPDVHGDLDCAAPRAAWRPVHDAVAVWGREHGLAAVVACDHAIGSLTVVGCGGSAGDRLLQVDLVDERLAHAIPVWTAGDLRPSATLVDGVRALAPGAEGLARILADRRDAGGRELAAADGEGARPLAGRLGLTGALALRPRTPGRLALELVLAARAIVSPRRFARAVRTDAARRACPVLAALADGRALREPADAWVARVAGTHEVTRLA